MRASKICLCLAVFLLLSGCGEIKYQSVEQTIDYLSSDKLLGREPQTEGSIAAQEFIAASLSELKLEPYGENYRHGYPRRVLNVESAAVTVGDRVFKYKTDFVLFSASPEGLSGSFEIALANDSTISLSEQVKISRASKLERSPALSGEKIGVSTLISASPEMFDYMSQNAGGAAKVELIINPADTTENNIVGFLEGDDSINEAVVVGAHFDHIGKAVSGEIFHGALDNASGTAGVLYVANVIVPQIKDGAKRDVYFALFNTEEYDLMSRMSGSSCLAGELEEKYDKVYCINLDCIGEKGKQELQVMSGNDMSLLYSAQSFFQDMEFDKVMVQSGNSDHISFKNGVTVTTGFENANVLFDTADIVDSTYVEKIADAAAKYAAELALGKEVPVVEKRMSRAEWNSSKVQSGVYPLLGQCVVTEYKDALCHISGTYENVKDVGRFGLDFGDINIRGDISVRRGDGVEFLIKPVLANEGELCMSAGIRLSEHTTDMLYGSPGTSLADIGEIVFGVNMPEDSPFSGRGVECFIRNDGADFAMKSAGSKLSVSYAGFDVYVKNMLEHDDTSEYKQCVSCYRTSENGKKFYEVTLIVPVDKNGLEAGDEAELEAFLGEIRVLDAVNIISEKWQ